MAIIPKKAGITIPMENQNLEESGENLVKTMNGSFFDDPKQKSKVFVKNVMSLIQLQNNNIIYNKAIYFKKSKKCEEYKNYHFFLTENGIYYLKNSKDEFTAKYMPFENTRVILVIRENFSAETLKKSFQGLKYGFKFYRNWNTAEIYTDNLALFHTWRTILMYKSIQHTFHEEFDVKKMIGKGSFAKVYYAIKKETGHEYAIKAFNKEVLCSQSFGKESLINEINIMKRLDHANILKIYEVFETKHSIYLVIELLEGGELIKRIKEKNKLNHKDIAKLMKSILSALEHIHSKGIMHRDLKPENILLRKKNDLFNIVIADFGLSTEIKLPPSQIFFKRCGTPGFVAPEILSYKEGQDAFYDEKCDIFSAGVIFYVLLTGKKLFNGNDYKEVLKENKECDIDFTDPILKELPSTALDLLKKMLFIFPQGRVSASKALSHKYFQDFLEEEEVKKDEDESPHINLKMVQMNLQEYNNDFSGMSPISPNKDGQSPIVMRKPALNGKTDTIQKLGTGCFASNYLIETSPKKNLGVSKFSQAVNEVGNKEPSDFGQAMGNDGSPSRRLKSGTNDLHKQAIINNYNKESSPKKKNLDTIPDENPQIKSNWENKKSGIDIKNKNFD